MSDRNYYVICEDNCKFPAMTREQIYAAIAEATGNTPSNVDGAFITKLKELNRGETIRFWIGTTAEFNALTEKPTDCVYMIADKDDGGNYVCNLNAEEVKTELKTYIDEAILNGVW